MISPAPLLPRISLGGLEVSRLIAGSNAISGFSHGGTDRSQLMVRYFSVATIKDHLKECESHGIDAIVARVDPFIIRVLGEYWAEGGKIRWIAQTAPEYHDPIRNIRQAKQNNASAIYIHGSEVDRLVEAGAMKELTDRVSFIRSLGLPAGAAAHNPRSLLKCQQCRVQLDFFFVCLYNIRGYHGTREEPHDHFQLEDRHNALATVRKLDRPCVVYKVYAAGRLSTDAAFSDLAEALRPTDGVLIGMFPPDHPRIVQVNVRQVSDLS